MVRCWKHSQHHLEEGQTTDGDSIVPSRFHFPHKVFWPGLAACLLLFVLIFGLTGHFRAQRPPPQIVRFSAPGSTGFVLNQSAVVDQQKDIVTFYVASADNQTSTVLFDNRQGLICYKPAQQKACFLQTMEESDYDNVRPFLRLPKHEGPCSQTANETETLRQTEFLGVEGSNPVDASTLGEPLQQLCQDRTIHWTHKTDGPGKQRLVYFCIDICFPSNICVSVCFYYLPE